jgi:hypothetical protein
LLVGQNIYNPQSKFNERAHSAVGSASQWH